MRAPRVARPRVLAAVVAFIVMLAAAGTLAAGGEWREWWDALDKPGWLVPIEFFFLVGALYYLMGATILYRVLTRTNGAERLLLTLLVMLLLVANEAWNYAFLGRESVTAGLVGMLGFIALTLALVAALWNARRRVELAILTPYVIWVLYDVVWTFELWRRNA